MIYGTIEYRVVCPRCGVHYVYWLSGSAQAKWRAERGYNHRRVADYAEYLGIGLPRNHRCERCATVYSTDGGVARPCP